MAKSWVAIREIFDSHFAGLEFLQMKCKFLMDWKKLPGKIGFPGERLVSSPSLLKRKKSYLFTWCGWNNWAGQIDWGWIAALAFTELTSLGSSFWAIESVPVLLRLLAKWNATLLGVILLLRLFSFYFPCQSASYAFFPVSLILWE